MSQPPYKGAATYDLVIVGNDAASQCLAAYAGSCGARTALVSGLGVGEAFQSDIMAPIPNAVWRKLDLQAVGARSESISRLVTLLPDREVFASYPTVSALRAALADIDDHDAHVLEDFATDMAGGIDGDNNFKNDIRSIARAATPAADVLKDYFDCDIAVGHISGAALMPAGAGAGDPGSTLYLQTLFAQDAGWVRLSADSAGWRAIFSERLQAFNVDLIDAADGASIGGVSGKGRVLEIHGSEAIKARKIIVGCDAAAHRLGVNHCCRDHVLGAIQTSTAKVRYHLSGPLNDQLSDVDAFYQIFDCSTDFQEARDAARLGLFPDALPVTIEILPGGDLIASSSYCPQFFVDADEKREWSGQDRQAITALITERIKSRIPNFASAIKSTKTHIEGHNAPSRRLDDCRAVSVLPRVRHAIAFGAKLVDKALEA